MLHSLILARVALVAAPLPAAEPEKPVWKSIFDGKTFNGWRPNGQGEWSIEDGAMVGRANKTKLYGHMVSDKKYGDFVIRFKYKCSKGEWSRVESSRRVVD